MKQPALLAACLLAATLAAQQDPPTSPPATAKERWQALQKDQREAMNAFRKQIQDAQQAAKAAGEAGKPIPAMPMRPDYGPLVAKAKAAAADFAGTDDAVQFLVFVVQNAAGTDKPAAEAALDTLVKHHADSEGMAQVGSMLPFLGRMVGEAKAAEVSKALAGSKNPNVRGYALFAQHSGTIEKADRDGEAYQSARSTLLAAAEVATDARLQGEIRGAIDLREKLGVGNIAPDIVGEDTDGVPFKLSDYRGKVVFLDFWGDW